MAGYCGLGGLFGEELLNGQLKIGKKYDKQWLLFDQIMIDSSKIELKTYEIEDFEYIKNNSSGKYKGYPSRTFIGNKYNKNGYSDHFPVSVKINIK